MRVRTAQPDLLNSSGKIIYDNFTSKSRSGKNEFVKRKLRLFFVVYCKGLPQVKAQTPATRSKLVPKCELPTGTRLISRARLRERMQVVLDLVYKNLVLSTELIM